MKTKVAHKKMDFTQFIKEFQLTDVELFKSYLTEIWRDLRLRNEDADLGINKHTFQSVIFIYDKH